MKILALDLGKYKTVGCEYESESGAHRFKRDFTTPAALQKMVQEVNPDRVVIEVCSIAKGTPRRFKPADDTNITTFTYETSICGRKRCLKLTRKGFGDWEWGCTDRNGTVINCVDPL